MRLNVQTWFGAILVVKYIVSLDFYSCDLWLTFSLLWTDFRAFYLHMYGGVYADLDTWCLRPMDSLVNKGKLYLAEMSDDTQFGQNIPVRSYFSF